MAVMIPIECDLSRRPMSEQIVFEVIKKNLSNEWYVFHSFDYVTRDLNKKRWDGEIDFLSLSGHKLPPDVFYLATSIISAGAQLIHPKLWQFSTKIYAPRHFPVCRFRRGFHFCKLFHWEEHRCCRSNGRKAFWNI